MLSVYIERPTCGDLRAILLIDLPSQPGTAILGQKMVLGTDSNVSTANDTHLAETH